jgi:outer membrane murein-binding lipoprotein Lpp
MIKKIKYLSIVLCTLILAGCISCPKCNCGSSNNTKDEVIMNKMFDLMKTMMTMANNQGE